MAQNADSLHEEAYVKLKLDPIVCSATNETVRAAAAITEEEGS